MLAMGVADFEHHGSPAQPLSAVGPRSIAGHLESAELREYVSAMMRIATDH